MTNKYNNPFGFIRDSHYLIIKHDFASRESKALPNAFVNKKDAIYEMESYLENYLKNADGENSYNAKPYNEAKITYICKNNLSDPGFSNVVKNANNDVIKFSPKSMIMEKVSIDNRWYTRTSNKWIPYQHFIVRNPQEHINKYTVWKKEKVSDGGYIWYGEDKSFPVFSLELVEVPNMAYNNLSINEPEAPVLIDEGSTTYHEILVSGLQISPAFNQLNGAFQKEPTAVSETESGTPTRETINKLSKSFYSGNVDSGTTISVKKLREDNPNDFVSWKCTGKSSGHWIPYILLTTSIKMK